MNKTPYHRPNVTSLKKSLLAAGLAISLGNPAISIADAESGKTIAPLKPDVPYVFVVHEGRSIRVERDVHDSFRARANIRGALIINAEACPPLCLLPMHLDVPVETWGELEIIDFMLSSMRDRSGVLLDIRSKKTYDAITIPGSINYFIQDMQKDVGTDKFDRKLESFGARRHQGISVIQKIKGMLGLVDISHMTERWDFTDAQTLVVWNNSPLSNADVKAIKILLEAGYPADKLKWYRGGMASWQYWGFNTVSKPKR